MWGRNPLVGPSEDALRTLGALSTLDVIDGRQYWRLLTSIFLCSGARSRNPIFRSCRQARDRWRP
jgi:hypothetical protein